MTLESKTGGVRISRLNDRLAVSSSATPESDPSPVVRELLACLQPESPSLVVCAPGRLDVLGGLSEPWGSFVVHTSLEAHVAVAFQKRSDQKVTIVAPRLYALDGAAPFTIALSDLSDALGGSIPAREAVQPVTRRGSIWLGCVIGALVEAVRSGLCPALRTGLTLMIGSNLPLESDVGQSSALSAAVMIGLAAIEGTKPDIEKTAKVCQAVEHDWLGRSAGLADAVCSLACKPRALSQFRGDGDTAMASVSLANELVVMGIDCGVVHPEVHLKSQRMRTATLMGCELIKRIIRHESDGESDWDGRLSRITVVDYVERFRDRLPTKLKGRDYLKRFGEMKDSFVTIEPDVFYKIRSRTEHHIYEHDRADRFIRSLSRATRNDDRPALLEAGDLMYASHWSYGQRCGLGCVEADLLVSGLRRFGPEAGIFGVKITGRGCGGVVAVLMQKGEQSLAAVETVLQDYHNRTGKKASILHAGQPGALHSGVRHFTQSGVADESVA